MSRGPQDNFIQEKIEEFGGLILTLLCDEKPKGRWLGKGEIEMKAELVHTILTGELKEFIKSTLEEGRRRESERWLIGFDEFLQENANQGVVAEGFQRIPTEFGERLGIILDEKLSDNMQVIYLYKTDLILDLAETIDKLKKNL